MAKIVKESKAAKVVETKKVKTLEDYYSIGKWKGLKQYKCNLCPFDSLDEKAIKDHIIERHMPKPPKPVVKVAITDRFGREIINKNK